MAKTLIIKSSILGTNSMSSAMADAFVAIDAAKHPDGSIIIRDLGAEPLPHLRGDVLGQMRSDTTELSAQVKSSLA